MFNPYTIILGLFVLSGLGATLWGWKIIVQAKKSLHWPSTSGVVVTSRIDQQDDDLLPCIEFRYHVNGKEHTGKIGFSRDITPTQEFCNRYLARFPKDQSVTVFYDPEDAMNATLEPGLKKGDSMLLIIGVITLLLGVILLFTSI